MNVKQNRLLLALVHAALAALTLSAAGDFLLDARPDGGWTVDVQAFRYFTIDSNLLAALSSLVLLVTLPWRKRGAGAPRWLWTLRLAATVGVLVTFAVVMVFLAPIRGYAYMLDGPDLYLHFVCPVLYALSFLLLEREAGVPARQALWGLVPVLVYGVFYLTLTVALRRWPDFYFFNQGGLWPLSAALVLAATAAISLGLWAGNRHRVTGGKCAGRGLGKQ